MSIGKSQISRIQAPSPFMDEQIERPVNWEYQENPYGESAKGIIVAQQAFIRRDDRFIQRDNKSSKSIINKARAMYQYANQISFDRNQNGLERIYENWPMEQDKYIEIDCESQKSEDNQVDIDFPCCDDIMAIIDTDKQQGNIYFIAKIKLPKNEDFSIALQRVRGGGHDVETVEILDKKDSYYLFKISMTSQIKIFKILLINKGRIILESKPFNFNIERIQYDVGISYDFTQNTNPNNRLSMSPFEGLLAASSFNLIDHIDFFERSLTIFEEKSKSYLEGKIEIDSVFEKFILNHKYPQKFLIQFQAILKSPQNGDDKTRFFRNPVIQKISKYFMGLMVNYELKIDEGKKISANMAYKLVQTYLQIISIEMINNKKFELVQAEVRRESEEKVASYLEFLIQQRRFEIVAKYVEVEMTNNFYLLHQNIGLGTYLDLIEESVEAFDRTYVDLSFMFIYYFTKFTELGQAQLISSIVKVFLNKKIVWEQLDENDRFSLQNQSLILLDEDVIMGYQIQIAEKISIPSKSYQLFDNFYKVIASNKHHQYLKTFFTNKKLQTNVHDFIESMARQIPDITELATLQKRIKIFVDMLLYEPKMNFLGTSSLLPLVVRRLVQSSNYSRGISLKEKCLIVHSLVLNTLMKNGSQILIETIKTILSDFGQTLKMRFSFKQVTQLINQSFDQAILSNLIFQDIYTNIFLKEIYRIHFDKENASDIQRARSDYSNWHNNFLYKPFINSFLVENIAKLLTSNQREVRRKKQIIQDLKNLIDRGSCPPYEKQTLKTIVQIDNFQLDEIVFLHVLTKYREKLFILKKIKEQGGQQKFTLESLISEFKRKALQQEFPAQKFFEINNGSRIQKNMIQKIFAPEQFMDIIQEKVHVCKQTFQKLAKYRNFIECLNKKYDLSDYQSIVKNLQEAQRKTRETKLSHIKQISLYLEKLDTKILKCYSFSSFFHGETAKNITLDLAIERCILLQLRITQNRDKVIQQYRRNQLTYQSVNFFKEQLSRQRELLDLFMMQMEENEENLVDPAMIKELLKIFSLLKKIPNIINYIKGLLFYIDIDQSGKFKDLNVSLMIFLRYLNQISNNVPGTNISQLYHEYQKANKLFSCFRFSRSSPENLNLEDQKSTDLLQFLYQMSVTSEKQISDLLSIKDELENMKEKCDEDEDEYQVDYEDLQVAELLIKYIENIYHSDKNQIRSLIGSTVKSITEHPRLKLSNQVFGKLDNLLYEFKHVNQGDKKMVQKIDQILQKCNVIIRFSENNTLSVQLLINDLSKQNTKVQITEEDIRKFKGEAVLYIIQMSEKKKTEEEVKKTKNYNKFLALLKSIDRIKEVWKELQEWGYIIFRRNEIGDAQATFLTSKLQMVQSEEDRHFLIENNNHQRLNEYIEQMTNISEQWIKQIRELHSISPKATLLQGQSLKNIYQILTGFSVQKVSNFLNICSPEQISEFSQKKKYKFQKKSIVAIHIIKEFFQSIANKVQQVKPSVMDYSECYLKKKICDQKKDDFIKGIIELDPQRIKNLDMTKMLICVDGTTRLDIKSFIDTALRDEKSQYIIIRPEKLSNKDQEYIINQIENHQKLNKKITLKLCLVTNSSIQSLYQYLVNKLPRGDNFIKQNPTQRQKAYRQFILSRTKNLKIITSSSPGYGKTSWILQNSRCPEDKSDKKQRKCFFLPISGAPQSESIYSRFQKITRQIYKRAKDEENPNKKLSSLVIQIHNVDPKHYQIVNTFLQQIVTGQCVRYNGKFPKLIQDTKIYIEIENVQSVEEYNPLTTFTFLKLILKEDERNVLKKIQQRPPIDFNKFDIKKIQYIIQHLDFFDRIEGGVNLLDHDHKDQNIKRFDEFQPKGFNEARGRQLFQKYLFDQVPTATFYQYHHFCRLLFDGCKAFSSSMGLTFTFLNEFYDNFYKKLFGLKTMRSQFFQVILKNCVQFIQREVDYQEFEYQGNTVIQEKLSSIPFLIIPNKDGESFSFIYKDHTQVPEPIRNFYISQNTELVGRIGNGSQEILKSLFEEHSIKRLQKADPKKFDEIISEILFNISGNKNYSIQKDPNYSVNIDNFFKMCLITLRQRQNIPIIIMGEAGTGKTALLKHVSEKLYESQFLTLNVNAGTKVDDLRAFLKNVRAKNELLKGSGKKVWIFFDEFNTLKQVGYIKEIMIDKRFEGKQLDFLQDIVMMAACNPFRKLRSQNNDPVAYQNNGNENNDESLAFHVLPPPHSMIESMWNYGALSPYEYEKYIQKMIGNIDYKRNDTTKLLLEVHKYLENQFDSSFVSLRDIQRFRTLYEFFCENLPRQPHHKTKELIYPGYNNYEQKALILSFVFCYTLRIEFEQIKNHIYQTIEAALELYPEHIKLVKSIQETDFFNRLKIDYASIASNSAIKQNCYAFFVAVYNKLPMILVGPPGCSKSLAIRILTQNMKGISVEDRYLKRFQAIRSITFQGSELCTSQQVQALFKKATNPNKNKKINDHQSMQGNQIKMPKPQEEKQDKKASLVVVVFDEIGLADKSKDNPLKVIHPYLEVSKELNLANQQSNKKLRNYSFIGISNTCLDLSKMSRMLVLKRPPPSTQELKQTAVGIGRSFQYGKNEKIAMMVEKISDAFFSFVDEWHKSKRFTNFFSLRDFYSLVKYFLRVCQQKQVNINDDKELTNIFEQAVFRNLHGMNGSVEMFMRQYRAKMGQAGNKESLDSKFSIIDNILESLEKQSIRFPLVIAENEQSLSYLINMLMNKFKKKTSYFERSPFVNDKNNNLQILRTTAQIIKTLGKGDKLILNNIQPTIQTSLYDMLNKFYIVRGDQNYCRISEVNSGLTKKTLVNKQFNCICFLLQSNLQGVEAPFLSRFEKYVFSLKKIQNAKQIESIVQQVELFKKTIVEICRQKSMAHYKIENFFQNCQRDIIRTLVLRIYNEIKNSAQGTNSQSFIQQNDENKTSNIEQIILRQVIYDVVMNSTQDFMMIYEYVLSKEPQMQIYSQSILRAIEKKKTFSIEQSNKAILFTTDTNVVFNGCSNPKAIKSIKVQQIKKQSSFDEMISDYLNSNDQKYLFVQLKAQQVRIIQYLISQIQKVEQQESISKGKSFQTKKIFILHKLDRKSSNQNNMEGRQSNGISFLSQYPQIFYEGNLEIGLFKYDRKDFFDKILDISHILSYVQDFFTFDIKCKDQENKGQILASFKRLYNEISNNKSGLFHAHIEQFIQKTEGTNVTINESLVLQVLENPEFLKNCRNFKEALTKQLSNKSFYGVVAFFLKFLFENQNILTYSTQQIYRFNSIQHFNLIKSRINFIQSTKRSAVYESNLKLLMSKKIEFFKMEYQNLKKLKRLPSIERKLNVELSRARLVHFSKLQNEIILSKSNESLGDLAKKINSTSSNLERDLRRFKQQLQRKSSFMIKNDGAQKSIQNLYISMNKDPKMKQLFIYELLIDFAQQKGLNIKYIEVYMKIIKLLINFDPTNNKQTLDIEYQIYTILAYQEVLTFIFKLLSVFSDNDVSIGVGDSFFQYHRIKEGKDITQENCARFVNNLIKNILDPMFTDQKTIQKFKGPKVFFQIFTNSMLQIENIEKVLRKKQTFSTNLASLRDVARFCAQFDEQHKFELLQIYIKKMNEKKREKNVYSVTFNFVESLNKKQLQSLQKDIIRKFQANKIFLQWFKDRPDDENCLQFFIQKCESEQNFCHNSMHVINYLLNQKEYDYARIDEVERVTQDPGSEMTLIAKYCKSKGFQNNLCILMVNIFLQKLQKSNDGKTHKQILQEHKNNFIIYYTKLSLNNLDLQLFQIFLFAFIKFVLISYTEVFAEQYFDDQISELLNGDNHLSANARLFCLKILRLYNTPKEIKEKFINVTRIHWSKKVQPDFKENQARSLIVPKDFCSPELTTILTEIQISDGSAFVLFEKMLEHAKGFENRYSILNFFLRFYYSLSYNETTYKATTIEHFKSLRTRFQQVMGKVQTNLIERYLNNQISVHFSVQNSQSVNQEQFIGLNFMNLFLASKSSISPLHSLFVKDGQLSSDVYELTKDQFSISGPENPFINIAESVIEMTRNNNIGVYICSSDCDYIYSHENCGWPRDQIDCPLCGQKIGSKGSSHTLSREEKGARRLMTKVLVDKSAYYVWSMTNLTEYWQVQRKYILVEINRMKLKKQTSILIKQNKQNIKLTGLSVVNSGRVSSFTYKLLSFFIDSISYLLISLKLIDNDQIDKLYGFKTDQEALNFFNLSIKKTIQQSKASLNLGNKFLGWMFGIQRQYIMDMNNFKNKFTQHQLNLLQEMEKLKIKLSQRISEKKISQDYINLYVDFVKVIEGGYFVKDQCQVQDFTASNRFTRDFSQKLFENHVTVNTGDKKFDFSVEYQSTQGKMQFPFDSVLTEDEIDKEKYNYYRIFKLPDQKIGHHEIVVKYEAIIRQKYPYLDYISKNSDQFYEMKNFSTIITYVNELHKQVNNRYERVKAEQPLSSFIQQLKEEQGNRLSKKLKNYPDMLISWNRLSKFLGILQNGCKLIGRMNDCYNAQTPFKAFLLDHSTKENPYGLMIGSVFHNFARMHNQSMAVLNSRKNQIKAYNSLNLFNDILKIHPQSIEPDQIFTLDDEQLKQNLEACSVASIIYGQNFIFHNFDAYQEYFIRKLEGKCEIISDLNCFINVCYNGEAFSAQSEGSGVLAEIREFLDKKLTVQSESKVKRFLKRCKQSQFFEKEIVQIRGDLEKIMLELNTLKGNYQKDQSCSQIIKQIQVQVNSNQLKNDQLSEIPICEIYDLYELLENELKCQVLKKLPQKYKAKMDNETAIQIQNFLRMLPKVSNDNSPSIEQLESAIMKFVSRTLQNGIFSEQKLLLEFLINREDFWPKDYDDNKKEYLSYDESMMKVQIANVFSFIQILNNIKKDS